MYLKINKKLREKIEEITKTDYEFKEDYLPSENIISVIESLIYEIDYLKEKNEDLEQDIKDNYRPVLISEQCEISDRDFY